MGPSTENPSAPERALTFRPYYGLQGRLAIGGNALFPDEQVEMKAGIDDKTFPATVTLMNKASVRERADYWKTKHPELTSKDAQLSAWKKSIVEKITTIPQSKLGADHGEFFTKILGVDIASFTDTNAQTLYDTYFGRDKGGKSIDIFMNTVFQKYKTAQGATDIEAIRKHLPALQWMAGMFGGNSSELITQLIDAEMDNASDQPTFIAKRSTQVNTLDEKEKKLLRFLTQGETVVEQPQPKPPVKPIEVKVDPIITITDEEINKLAKQNEKPQVVSLGKDNEGKEVLVHLGFPDKKDAHGYTIFPSEPYIFVPDNLAISDKNHNVALKNVCVIAAHGIRTPDGVWRFLNQQQIYKTVSMYNDYAKKNGLPPIEFIMSCNAPGSSDVKIVSINTGDGTVVQSDNFSINVGLFKDVNTGESGATASYGGEFVGLDELIKRKKSPTIEPPKNNKALTPEFAQTDPNSFVETVLDNVRTNYPQLNQVWEFACKKGIVSRDKLKIDPNTWMSESDAKDGITLGTHPMSPGEKYRIIFNDAKFDYPAEVVYRLSHELSHKLLYYVTQKLNQQSEFNHLLSTLVDLNKLNGKVLSALASQSYYRQSGTDTQGKEDMTELINMYLQDPNYLKQYLNFLADDTYRAQRQQYGLVDLNTDTAQALYETVERGLKPLFEEMKKS